MNIFERRDNATKELNQRAQVFVRLAAAAIDSLSDKENSSDSLPGFINSYHGFHAEVFPFDNSRWIPNPNYKPGLSSEEYKLPENSKVDAGFSQINVIDKMCRVCAVEIQDSWDDCAGEPETWNLEMIPQDLFLTGTEPEIVAFFTEHFRIKVERENEAKFRSKWSNLFYYYTLEELEDAVANMKVTAHVGHDGHAGKRFEAFLGLMRGTEK